jgi:hypothetical protein
MGATQERANVECNHGPTAALRANFFPDVKYESLSTGKNSRPAKARSYMRVISRIFSKT